MDINSLKSLLGGPRDSALLRMTLANALLSEGLESEAELQLVEAIGMDGAYTAAWKQLGKVCLSLENKDGAREAWQAGIDAAIKNGDKQAEKEMTVFIKRLDR